MTRDEKIVIGIVVAMCVIGLGILVFGIIAEIGVVPADIDLRDLIRS